MPRYEYMVVPAPKKGVKTKTARTSEDRFAAALAALMNEHARDGWNFQRAETLPMVERKGLTGSATTYQNMLVFRRQLSDAEASLTPPRLELASPRPAPALASPPIGPADRAGKAPALGPARLVSDKDADMLPDGDR